MHWLRDSDLNIKFFNMSAITRRRFKRISMLRKENNEEVRNQAGLCEVSSKYFDNLFVAKNGNYDPVLDNFQ